MNTKHIELQMKEQGGQPAQPTQTTQGSWQLTFDEGGPEFPALRDSVGKLIADVYGHENGRRIVACVNACEGISTEDLGRYYNAGGGIDQAMEEAALRDQIKVQQQRDQLLVMLEEVLDKVPFTDSGQMYTPTATKARAIIAAVKGGVA